MNSLQVAVLLKQTQPLIASSSLARTRAVKADLFDAVQLLYRLEQLLSS